MLNRKNLYTSTTDEVKKASSQLCIEMLLLKNGGRLLLELIAEVTNEMPQIQSIKQTKVSQLQPHRFTI